jgi:hypothetical protein
MTEQETALYQLLADSLAAVGTLAAVFVALWLAKNARQPRLAIYLRSRSEDESNLINLTLVNIGTIPITVSGLRWKLTLIEEPLYVDAIQSNDLVSYPVELNPGQSSVFLITFEQIGRWQKTLLAESRFALSPVCLFLARIQVYTNIRIFSKRLNGFSGVIRSEIARLTPVSR